MPVADPLTRATRATAVAFIANGFAFASFASRIPQVRDRFHLSPSQLGLVLLATGVGALVALPLSGPFVARYGSRRVVTAMALLLGVAQTIASLGFLVGLAPLVVGVFLLGLANGSWDVAMNVQGAVVEQRLGRSVMPRFHAGFSLGTVAGALVGAPMVALGVPVTAHLLVVGLVVSAAVARSVQAFVPDTHGPEPDEYRPGTLAAWREPRTLLIGVFVLAFAFAEGTGNDWVAVALIDGYGATASLGTLAFAAFLAAMTLGRWFGPALLDRHGRVGVVRAIAVLAVAGLLLFVLGGATPVAFAGALLWGAGTSLGFPVGMSAAADDPHRAAARVSVVSSIGYCAFLGGPPLVGFLGDRVGVLHAMTVVAALLALAALVATATRQPGPVR